MEFTVLDTPRLRLLKTASEEYDYVFTNYTENEIKAFFGCVNNDEYLLERKRYEGGLETFNKKCLVFRLIDKTTNDVIGWCGYHTWYTDHDRAELGYGLAVDKYKGNGLMSEALKYILSYGFDEMNLYRIEAMISPDNKPSLRLVEKFNFSYEGLLREHYKVDGVNTDSAVYSLLKHEFHKSSS